MRFVAKERWIWALSAAALLVGSTQPATFSAVALLCAAALALRLRWDVQLGLSRSVACVSQLQRDAAFHPYRLRDEPASEIETKKATPALLSGGAHSRLWVAVALAVYVAAWGWSWRQGPWPAHVLALDLLATAVLARMAWKRRSAYGGLAGAGIWVHAASCSQLALLPRSSLGWGVGLVAAGFFALIVGVVINVWLARRAFAPGAVPGEPPTS